MSHETLIYGFIEGSTYTSEEYRVLQERNTEAIEQLPKQFDEYPGLCRGMFSWPTQEPMQGGWRAQMIHFGGSFKNIDNGYSDIAIWIEQFERLLATLYWFQAVAHVQTELMGELAFTYEIADEMVEPYQNGNPSPTKKWTRKFYVDKSEAEFKP